MLIQINLGLQDLVAGLPLYNIKVSGEAADADETVELAFLF